MLDQQTLKKFEIALEKERDLLTKELETIATRDPHSKDNWNIKHFEWGGDQITSKEELEGGESVNESDEDMKNKALSDNLELRLRDVNNASQRIKEGSYGICAVCKNPIPIDRLKANPAAETDMEHAEK
ncbi:MAG: TraR/DksA C4-type zinc finger protein [Candidatus Azambacteria bacterium]|nr:TraR/DksA C4-type zinc finger protein [Candidatus Azambacteria bacterium]